MRTCSVCGDEKPLDQFHRQAKGRDGRMANCKACHAEYHRRWREANPEKWKAAKRKAMLAHRRRQRARVIEAMGGACATCGEADPIVLELDHVNEDGNKDRRRPGGPMRIYREVLRGERDDLMLLCANCHLRAAAARMGA